MFVIQLICVCFFFSPVISSGRHSLWTMASFISGSTVFPEFSAVFMLDDIQVGYYDSVLGQIRRSPTVEGAEMNIEHGAMLVMQDTMLSMQRRLTVFKHRFNLTTGVQVQQRLMGCEVSDGRPKLIMFRDGVNGQDADSLMCNMTHFTYTENEDLLIPWDAVERTFLQTLYDNIYLPVCTKILNYLLDHYKHVLTRRIRPRVHLIQKQLVGGAQLTCLATDFYPRHINLTLLQNGKAVDEDRLMGGMVLPNNNGLYQVRKTLMVSDEELQLQHNYTCVASHLSLDNRLQVTWRAEFSRTYRIPIISVPVALTFLAILVVMLLLWKRRLEVRGGYRGKISKSAELAERQSGEYQSVNSPQH